VGFVLPRSCHTGPIQNVVIIHRLIPAVHRLVFDARSRKRHTFRNRNRAVGDAIA
jgi:hypothetical protein